MLEVELVRKEKDELEFVLKGVRHSFPSLLRQYLLEDKSVEFASYNLTHPLYGNPKFVIKTKGSKTPYKALVEASEAIEKDLKEMEKQFKSKPSKN